MGKLFGFFRKRKAMKKRELERQLRNAGFSRRDALDAAAIAARVLL